MFHSETYITNWHDTGMNRRVRPSALLIYMQETASAHMKTFGPSLDELRDNEGLAFVLSRLSVRFGVPVGAYETIRVTTWLSESRGVAFNRHFRIERAADGALVAEAASVWALIRLADRSFARPTEVPMPTLEEPIEDLLSHRVRMPKIAFCPVAEHRVMRSECDYNHHMNNTRYPDLICDLLPGDDDTPAAMTLIWRHEATLDHVLQVERGDVLPAPGKEPGEAPGTAPGEGTAAATYYFRATDPATGDLCLEAEVTCPAPVC